MGVTLCVYCDAFPVPHGATPSGFAGPVCRACHYQIYLEDHKQFDSEGEWRQLGLRDARLLRLWHARAAFHPAPLSALEEVGLRVAKFLRAR